MPMTRILEQKELYISRSRSYWFHDVLGIVSLIITNMMIIAMITIMVIIVIIIIVQYCNIMIL